ARSLGVRPDLASEQALEERQARRSLRGGRLPAVRRRLRGRGRGIEQGRDVFLGEELLPVRSLLERLLPFRQRDPAVPIPVHLREAPASQGAALEIARAGRPIEVLTGNGLVAIAVERAEQTGRALDFVGRHDAVLVPVEPGGQPTPLVAA